MMKIKIVEQMGMLQLFQLMDKLDLDDRDTLFRYISGLQDNQHSLIELLKNPAQVNSVVIDGDVQTINCSHPENWYCERCFYGC